MPVANEILLDAFGRVREEVPRVVAGLTVDQLAWYPAPAANSIAWLIWHLARVQDDHLAGVASRLGGESVGQVWTDQGWVQRFGLPFPTKAIGYGQTAQEAHKVRCEGQLLGDYYEAVYARTEAIVSGLTDHEYEVVVDERWNPPVTVAVRLVSVVNDVTAHIGQAAYVRGLLA